MNGDKSPALCILLVRFVLDQIHIGIVVQTVASLDKDEI